jgi:hypothetical protein
VFALKPAGAYRVSAHPHHLGQSVLVGGDSDSDDPTEVEGILIDQDNLDEPAE